MEDLTRINNTLGKMRYYLTKHNCICVSVSGGSDSDIIVHVIATYFREFLPKIHFVFVNTGLEWSATKRHLDDLEHKYDINIDRIRGMSVVTAVRKYGIPVISKRHTSVIDRYARDVPSGVRQINLDKTKAKGYVFSAKQRQMADAIKERGVKVSDKCCDYSKKIPLHHYYSIIGCDLAITGERRAEGGQRAASHTNCFEPANNKRHQSKYMPLFFWDDETKAWYKEHEGIVYSDCYEIYGMKRTGCVGCPFNSRAHDDLLVAKEHEPNLYKAVMNVFGQSYSLMDEFDIRKIKILEGLEERRE